MCNFLSNTIRNTEKTVYQSSCPVLARGCRHHRKNPESPSYAQLQNSQLVSGETEKEEEKRLEFVLVGSCFKLSFHMTIYEI